MALKDNTAKAVWKGDLTSGAGTVHVNSGAFPDFPVSWGARTEAAGKQTNPEELIAAAHATCFSMAFAHELGQAGSPPESLEVEATCSIEKKPEGGIRISTMRIKVKARVPGSDDKAFRNALAKAEQGCPVSNALRGNVDISVDAKLER